MLMTAKLTAGSRRMLASPRLPRNKDTMDFSHFTLHDRLHRALRTAGYDTPTPIQAAAMPIALTGHDIVGTAQTGTGKTAAFVLPILQRLMTTPARYAGTRALILAPTRELAEQIHETFKALGAHTNIRSATIYGGVGMTPQENAFRKGTEVIVACPGRLLDHVERGNTDFSQVECLVLDEADRLLDMGFLPPITRIIKLLPSARQTMLFSATFAPELNSFVNEHLRQPQRVEVGITAPPETVSHTLYPVPQHLKTALLTEVLKTTTTESVLIFTRTKHRANRIMEQLVRAGYEAGVLHANKSQNHRQATLDAFRAGTMRMLVATDIAARGIDVTTISHVINYDIPDCADTYIHRIGRTGRMARTGEAITFVTMDDAGTVRDIERTLRERIPLRTIEGFDYSKPAPRNDDEFKRAPRPPRNPARSAAPAAPARSGLPKRADKPSPPRQEQSAPARQRQPVQAPPSAHPAARQERFGRSSASPGRRRG